MKVGAYTAETGLLSEDGNSTVNLGNVIFTRFGGVVGFTNDGTAWNTNMSQVKFDPMTTKATTWAGILSWSDYTGAKGYDEGYISTTNYHTVANVKAGFGDICQLAGIKASEISPTNYKNTTWRLPTNRDNQNLVGDDTRYNFFSGSPGHIQFSTGHTLPALGVRQHSTGGSSWNWGTWGQYWASTASDEGGGGHSIEFDASHLRPAETDPAFCSHAIRCVRQ